MSFFKILHVKLTEKRRFVFVFNLPISNFLQGKVTLRHHQLKEETLVIFDNTRVNFLVGKFFAHVYKLCGKMPFFAWEEMEKCSSAIKGKTF